MSDKTQSKVSGKLSIRRDSQLTVTDLFCGAGGWTEGVEQAGALVWFGVNHWQRACETYATNHVLAKVDCNDISMVNPGRYPRTDVLIASPECTTHSPAGGHCPKRSLLDEEDPALEAELKRIERSRVTMHDVVRFAEHHRYDAIIVENVVEVRRWELFDWWLQGMMNLGYAHETVFMNSMVAWPTPQSRDRIYIVFWRSGNRRPDLRFDVSCWCPKCEVQVEGIQSWKQPARPWGKYRTQYVYRCPRCATASWPFAYPAATAIDWSLPAPRIGDRKRPLADKTMARIKAGLEKFGPAAIVAAAGNTWERPSGLRAWSIDEPIQTQATTAQHALVMDTSYGGSAGHIRSTDQPLASQTARQSQALVVPLRTHGKAQDSDRSVFPTVVAGNAGHALLVPAGGTWNEEARPVSEPMRARTSRENEGLAFMPFIDTKHRLVTPPGFVMRNNDGARATGFDEPIGTLTGKGHQSVVAIPMLVPYFGTGVAHEVTEPMGTVTGKDRRALVLPEIDVEDCGFRMLEPHEIKAAMAFPDAYKILGNKREQVKQCGNAVTPPAAMRIFARVAASLS